MLMSLLAGLPEFNSGVGTWTQCYSVLLLTLEKEEELSSPHGQSTLIDKPQYEDPKTNHSQCQDIERHPSGARRPLCIWILPETRQLSVLASENTHFIPQYDRPRELRVWNGILANILK